MKLYVEKETDLMRSTLSAIGLAHFIQSHFPIASGAKVRLQDMGSVYCIMTDASEAALRAEVARYGLQQLLPAIKKKFSEGDLKALQSDSESPIRFKYVPQGFPAASIVDYEAEQERMNSARTAKKANRQEGDTTALHPDFPVWAHLASHFGKGSVMRLGYPALVHTWYAHQGEAASDLLELIFYHYGELPQDGERTAQVWKEEIARQLNYQQFELNALITANAVVSPTGVQGNSRIAVAESLNNGSLDAFWLEMYFALLGYMIAGMPYRRGKDVILYYPLPKDIEISQLINQINKYRRDADVRALYKQYSIERAKLDSLAYLNYYIAIMSDLPGNSRIQRNKKLLNGLVAYYYRDLGGTQIPFDETVFAPPDWLPLDSPDAIHASIKILQQHKALISKIYGPQYDLTSDELVVVNAYRNFISRGDSATWIDFAVQYHAYAFATMTEKYIEYLSKELVEETLMAIKDKVDYRPIIENDGFQAIANAIRHCTVLTQYKEIKKQNPAFRVRHGLGRDLMRRSHNPEHFIEDLSNFVYDYIRESASVEKNLGETRAYITVENIADIVALVANYGSRVVASLLVAVGYASNFKKKEEN